MPALALSDDTRRVLEAVEAALRTTGGESYLVGGAVRDLLLGRTAHDLDVAVTADPAHLARRLGDALEASVVTLDERRRVYRLVFRGGGLTLDLTPIDGGLEADLRRRDFTIDALAAPLAELLKTGREPVVIDVAGGLGDLREKRVRAVAPNTFRDDPGRLLRTVRLSAELGFAIDDETASLAQRDAPLVSGVAPERVRDELCRILDLPGAAGSLRSMDGLGLLTAVLPELEPARGVAQPKEHYFDVLEHSIETVAKAEEVLRQSPAPEAQRQAVPWDAELEQHFQEQAGGGQTRALFLKLAALLHDVAKPATKTIDPDGRIRFLGHPRLGAEMTGKALTRLRFGNRETRIVVTMVEQHLRPGLISRDEGPTPRATWRFFRDAADAEVDTLFLSLADYLAARGPLLETEDWQSYAGKIRGILETWRLRNAQGKPPKLIDGHDLMRELGLQPGPLVGELLEAVEEARSAGDVSTKEQALALAASVLRTKQKAPERSKAV